MKLALVIALMNQHHAKAAGLGTEMFAVVLNAIIA
jgi:hypothetical protein